MNEPPNDQNPYAFSQGEAAASDPQTREGSWEGLWRDGEDLVLHKQARLPRVCVATGEPAEGNGVVNRFSWSPPYAVFTIARVALQKAATVDIPLSGKAKRKRNFALLRWILVIVACILTFFSGFWLVPGGTIPVTAGLGLMAGCVLIGWIAFMVARDHSRILRATKITDTHIWLRGVHPSIRERLPELPGP